MRIERRRRRRRLSRPNLRTIATAAADFSLLRAYTTVWCIDLFFFFVFSPARFRGCPRREWGKKRKTPTAAVHSSARRTNSRAYVFITANISPPPRRTPPTALFIINNPRKTFTAAGVPLRRRTTVARSARQPSTTPGPAVYNTPRHEKSAATAKSLASERKTRNDVTRTTTLRCDCY